ncbi:MAG: VOC family protein [Devosia sp.]|jgi:methylmalonyl-CoA/ethylmalonyl-CoA epimerase|nr:VOC family protein [Devosia sp.]
MTLNQLGQIAIAVSNTDAAEAFYGGVLGLRKLYRYGDLCFFDCAGVRLMLSPPENGATVEAGQGAIYFRVPDLLLATAELSARGADIVSQPHLTAPMPDHDLWMAFCRDPDGHLVGLMMEAPKGYAPAG